LYFINHVNDQIVRVFSGLTYRATFSKLDTNQPKFTMGKGDRKTKKGKITKGTFGVSRPHSKGRGSHLVNPGEAKPEKKKKKK
jgi:30S ribosomal protein S31